MAGASKGKGKSGAALVGVKTKAKTDSKLTAKSASAKAAKAGKPAASGDSPKRQGDKLANATRQAAGRPKT